MSIFRAFRKSHGILCGKFSANKNIYDRFSNVSNVSNIGFVGLGNMGGHMARNLLKKGYKLIVYDVDQGAMSRLTEYGAKAAVNISEVAKSSDVIVSMLPTNQHVLNCYASENGILTFVKPNTLLIDSSTISPVVSQSIAEKATKIGANFIDGPVSGGVNAAESGTLTFMVGGSKSNFDNAKPVLEAMGSRIVYCGDVGLGQVAKLCNNMLLGITMIGVAETFNLGEKLGLDSTILSNIINSSSGRCWSSELYNPVPGIMPNVPSSKNYEGGFGIKLMAKDLGIAQSIATDSGTSIPFGALAHQIYRSAITHGLESKDFSVIYKFLKGDTKL